MFYRVLAKLLLKHRPTKAELRLAAALPVLPRSLVEVPVLDPVKTLEKADEILVKI